MWKVKLIFITRWPNLVNYPCLHIKILKQCCVKGCGNYIFPGRVRKWLFGKIHIEINSNMAVELHNAKI